MKKTNFTYSLANLKLIWLSALLFLFAGGFIHVQAQDGCSMACNSWTQVSLDEDCGADIIPSMLLNGEENSCDDNMDNYSVDVKYQGQIIDGSPFVGEEWIGYTLKAQINHDSGNSCWGDIYIEDKLPPDITCNDVTISCFEEDTYLPDAVDACEGPVDAILINQYPVDFDCENDGDEVKILMRVYVASDSKGNVSDPCTVKVTLDRIDVGEVECPQDYTLADGTALACNNLMYWTDDEGELILDDDDNPILDPNFYGVPTYEGYDLWPNPTFKCGLSVTFEDTELETINCVRKIMRIWTVREWYCTAEFVAPDCIPTEIAGLPGGSQIFEIDDDIDPVIEADYDIEVSTNGYTCEMNVHVPPPVELSDMCFGIAHVDVLIDIEDEEVPDIFIPNFNYEDGEYHILPDGEHLVTYTAYDLCHNSSSDELTITIKDNTPPVVVCDEFTVISVTLDGEAEVHASVFDDGSYDDCHLKQMLVRRMDDGCPDCETPKFDGFNYLGQYEGTGNYYYLSHYKFKGNKSHKLSTAMGGYLVSLNTISEGTWVNNKVREYTDGTYWIGLTDKEDEGEFIWADGTDLEDDYSNWAGGEGPCCNEHEKDFVKVDADRSDQWNESKYKNEHFYVLEIEDPCGWSSYERFCCNDIGGEDVMVAFRAIDRWGNYNDCMVSAEIQDKLPPQIYCPPDLTIECGFDWPSLDVFGSVQANQADVEAIVIPNGYLLGYSDPHLYDGYAVDNCDVTVSMDPEMDGLNQCGLGTIYRHFTATDPGGRTATCTQSITFKQGQPFFCNPDYNGDDPFDDVDWPSDFEGEGCENPDDYDPEDLNPPYDQPIVYEDECDLVGVTHEDHVFLFNNDEADACFKILRKWKLIDWCQFDPSGDLEDYTWTWTQVIKINNTVAPVLTSSCAPVDTCTYDNLCLNGPIELIMTAIDGETEPGGEGPESTPCTPAEFLRWEYKIDFDNDGSFDGPSNNGTGGTANASGTYQIGHHSIRWTFEDRCGNKTTCDQLFNIVNCKAPTAYCYDGLAVDLMPLQEGGGMVILWASDFDAGSNHVCPDMDVVVSFSKFDLDDIFMEFTCDDLGPNDVTIYAHTITPHGIKTSKCIGSLDVQDNPDNTGKQACEEGGGEVAFVSGFIANEMQDQLDGVSVDLEGSELMAVTTDDLGEYAFPEMPTGGSYTVNPTKNVDPLNGVSTLDLVLIQKYILGLDDLDSPYKIIAADINLDDKVSASDIVELRKLILGVATNFQNNESWRFVDQGYAFNDPTDPLEEAFPEVYAISNLNSDMDIDFTAVKVGDVNTSAEMNDFASTEVRGLAQLSLEISDQKLESGEVVTIPVRVSDAIELLGYQFTIEFDQTAISIQGMEAGLIEVADENFGMNRLQEGMMTTSWHDSNAAQLNSGDVLFSLNVQANESLQLSDVLDISSRITNAEAYNADNDAFDLALEFRTNSGESFVSYKLYQNTPNPFSASTLIAFNLPQAMDASISVYDVTGKQINLIRGSFAKGYNEVEISSAELNISGVLYYTLETEEFTATKKMVVLK